jgi:hypothetical protein
MTSSTIRIASIAAMVFALVGTDVGAASQHSRSSGRQIIAVLKRSRLPLTTGGEDCRVLAEQYSTLGSLVRAHDKLANRERTATCGTDAENAGVLRCTAQFSNRVPAARSEEEFTLRLEFEMTGQTISALKCFLAG